MGALSLQRSLEESLHLSGGAVDVHHEGGESIGSVHDVLLERLHALVNVGLIGILTLNEVCDKQSCVIFQKE